MQIDSNRKSRLKALAKPLVPASLRPTVKSLYARMRFFGLRYQCPFCGSLLRTFLPYGEKFPVLVEKKVVGGGYRNQALCPLCGADDRERLLYLYLRNKTDAFERSQRLLHVAPELRVTAILQKHLADDYLTADLSGKNVMVQMDITAIPYPANFFDAIICNHVLEHIADDQRAMSELFRTLKPDGWAILQVPISLFLDSTYEDFSITAPEDRELAFGQADHVRIYGMDYKDRLDRVGFKVQVFSWTSEPDPFGSASNRFGLNEDENIYVARKPRAL